MQSFQIDTDDFKRASARFESASRNEVTGTLHRLFRKVGAFLVVTMREEMPKGASKKLSRYANYQIVGVRDLELHVYDGQQYGRYVRGGTRPHWPPVEALIPWVVAKMGLSGKAAERRAFLVARGISRHGTKANPYHVRTLDKRRRDIEAAAAEEGVRLVAYLAEK